MDQAPRVFVGSSTESSHVAEALKAVLEEHRIETTHWADVFTVGQYQLVDLLEATEEHDFAVFVFAPDDELTSRGTVSMAPRDNVVYELGLFTARLDPGCVVVLKAEGESVKVPSDLAGVTYAIYRAPDAEPSSSLWESAVRTAARKVERAIVSARARRQRARERSMQRISQAKSLRHFSRRTWLPSLARAACVR